MEINPNVHFTSGEFAKLCDTSKQTLYHYDNIGIFSPELKDNNGYRYYSYQQIEVFGAITMLKDIGLPLNEIKDYLSKRSPEELIKLLNNEKANVIRKIDELERIKLFIDRKIHITNKYLNENTNDIVVCNLDDKYFIATEVLDSSTDKKVYEAFMNHVNHCSKYNINGTHFVGSIIKSTDILLGNYSIYSHVFTHLREDDRDISTYYRAKGEYVLAYHKGSYYTTKDTYLRIIDFIKTNNLTLESDFYEEIILDDLSVKGYENYLLRIYVKVSKRQKR